MFSASRPFTAADICSTSTEKVSTEEGSFTAADQVHIFYRKLGAEHDFVVFLHGGPRLSMGDGGYAMRPLAEQHTLILYDQRGGRSDLIKDPKLPTADADVRDLEALRLHFAGTLVSPLSMPKRIRSRSPELSSSIRCRLR
jgi:hypothetical protein